MQFILVSLCVKFSLQNFNLIVYGAQNLFVGFRMSAYEQIRNRLSSNGKVTQEANVFSNSSSKRVSLKVVTEKIFFRTKMDSLCGKKLLLV